MVEKTANYSEAQIAWLHDMYVASDSENMKDLADRFNAAFPNEEKKNDRSVRARVISNGDYVQMKVKAKAAPKPTKAEKFKEIEAILGDSVEGVDIEHAFKGATLAGLDLVISLAENQKETVNE